MDFKFWYTKHKGIRIRKYAIKQTLITLEPFFASHVGVTLPRIVFISIEEYKYENKVSCSFYKIAVDLKI